MINSRLTATVVAICVLGTPAFVAARTFPGGGGGGGVRPIVPIAIAIHNRNSSYGDYGGITYNYNFGGTPTGIGMQPAAAPISRPQPPQSYNPAPSQAQLNRDWWLQYEGRQVAHRGGGYGAASAGYLSGYGIEAADPPTPVAMDVIKWPVLLQRPTFASRRAQIEAPYRRSPPGLSNPTADDYRRMITIAEEMKAMLDGLLQEGALQTSQLNEAESFLNKLQKEARDRARQVDAKSRTSKS